MKIQWILLVLFHLTDLIQTGKPCEVDVNPKLVFVPLNESLTFICTSNCKPLLWESRLQKENIIENGGSTSVQVKVDDWSESLVQCLAISDAHLDPFYGNATVIPYALPSKVDLNMPEEMKEGKEYEVTCQVYGVAPVNILTISLTRDGEILQNQTYEGDKVTGLQNLTKTFMVTVSRSDDQQEFGCQAKMNLIGVDKTTVQSTPVTISVLYPPSFTLCPESHIWLEGQNGTFVCLAEGNPAPLVQCTFNEEPFQPPKVFSAERNMPGSYECEASNSQGNITRSGTLTIQYPPETPVVISSANTTVHKGASFNLSCHSDALPAPVYHWKIPPRATALFSSDNRTIFIKQASSDYSGSYSCEVSNKHGQSKTEQNVEVENGHTLYWIIVVGIIIGAVVLLALPIIYMCKKDKKGFYDLLKRKPNSQSAIPLAENSKA